MAKTAIDDDEELDLSAGFRPHGSVHPAGTVTAFDEATGLPIVRRTTSFSTANEGGKHEAPSAPSHDNHPRPAYNSTGSAPDSKGRDVLHQSTDRAELVQQAKDHARQFEDGLKASTQGIKGAHFDSVRDEKNAVRLDEKINDEGQPVETIPDILAGRIAVDTPEAHERTAKSVRDHFTVIRDKDQFDKGDPDTGFRAHKLQVKVTPQLSAEIHIVPREIAEINDKQHKVYEAARDAEIDGDAKEEGKQTAKAKRMNDGAMSAFRKRNAETKYKCGSVQADVPKDSDAYRAVKAAQVLVADEDLAGDGKNIDVPHVTVRYGIQGDNVDGICEWICKQPPFTVTLCKTDAFPPSPNSDGAAVIIAPAESDCLTRMNAEIAKHGDFKDSDFAEYCPHVTVAYVRPEAAPKYTGMDITCGKFFTVYSVCISNAKGEKKEIPLSGKMESEVSDGKSDGVSADRNFGQSRFAGRRQDGGPGKAGGAGGKGREDSDISTPQRSSGVWPERSARTDDTTQSTSSGDDRQSGADVNIRRSAQYAEGLGSRSVHESGSASSQRGISASENMGGRGGGDDWGASPRLAKGVTVLIGSDSHGIVRGGNPNFTQGGRWSVETPDGTKTFKGSQLTPIAPEKTKPGSQWIGVDVDKTLAKDHGWKGLSVIGRPIPEMVERVKKMIADGKDVRIFTARVSHDPKGVGRAAIEAWCYRNLGKVLPITDTKDQWFKDGYDDRMHRVEANTGRVLA